LKSFLFSWKVWVMYSVVKHCTSYNRCL